MLSYFINFTSLVGGNLQLVLMVLIYIFLVANEVKYLFILFSPLQLFFFLVGSVGSLSMLILGCFSFSYYCSTKKIYIQYSNSTIFQLYGFQIYSDMLWLLICQNPAARDHQEDNNS